MLVQFIVFSLIIQLSNGITSPIPQFMTYQHSVELQTGVADLSWTVNAATQMIVFELHMNTTGWIALGISPAGGMTGADIGVGWIDQSGVVYFQDRYASGQTRPVIDNNTDWFLLRGRQQNGWTAIQFQRLLDTCDSMDVAIKSGTNHLIFAYGLDEPSPYPPNNDISYHYAQKGMYSLALQSYGDPPLESKYAQVNRFDFRLSNYTIPATDTTYHCKVYKAPVINATKLHVTANKIMINSTDTTLVHHLLLYECDPTTQFDDANLPSDLCENIFGQLARCLGNLAIGWAVGGDFMSEYPPEAGYPIGGSFSIKYYVIQMHYSNTRLCSNCTDNSGIRFYTTNQLRPNDIGYFTLGTDASALSLIIPPNIRNFAVDSYCPLNASSSFPSTGITVLSAFPHTHLQGKSIWTKLIRNKTVVRYLFNAESYDFNYQFLNNLPERIQLYPGDEFVTRCVYSTMNKNTTTFGGEKTTDEMCLHMFAYYPRVPNMYTCLSIINPQAWRSFLKMNSTSNMTAFENAVSNINWTSGLASQWQDFYNNASRVTYYGRGLMNFVSMPKIPEYADVKQANCTAQQNQYTTTATTQQTQYTTTASTTPQVQTNTTVSTTPQIQTNTTASTTPQVQTNTTVSTTPQVQNNTTASTTTPTKNNSVDATLIGDLAMRQMRLIFVVFLLLLTKVAIDI